MRATLNYGMKTRKPWVHFTTSDAQVTIKYWKERLNAGGFQPHQKILYKQTVDDKLFKYFEIDNSNLYSVRTVCQII